MSITQEIKDYALSLGMDIVGIAPVSRFEESPPGKHPCDVLPGTKSVIVFANALLDGAVQAQFRRFEEGKRHVHAIYGTFGYTMTPNYHLMYTEYFVAKFIERRTGYTATPLPCGPMMPGAPISMRHCALAAGLGEFGWNGLILTPEFGPRQRFGAVLTQAELEPDPMYNGPKLCDPSKCQVCVEKCVPGALSKYNPDNLDDCRQVHMDGKTFRYCYLDWNRCRVACHELNKKVGGLTDYVTSESPTPNEISDAIEASGIDHTSFQHYPTWKCGHCMAYCTAGDWEGHFAKTGLSTGHHAYEKFHAEPIRSQTSDTTNAFGIKSKVTEAMDPTEENSKFGDRDDILQEDK